MRNGIKNMLRLSSVMAIGLLAACGSTVSENDSSAATNESEQEQVYIGILQLTTHPALDQITEGILDELAAAGYVDGENATIDFQNAQGDQANMKSIAESFVSHDADIMIGVATPAAQALKNASDEIPVILGAVQDPVGAGLVESLEVPGSNVTGLSNRTPSNEQMALIKQFLPDATTIGVMYTTAEDNAIISGQRAEQAAADLGFEVVTRTITTSNDIAQAAESLAKEVDAIYVPNDNVIASGMATLVDAADAFGI
ncbi:MAG: ABC transporter substrate-binding protein, partial [Trichococcus sp.]|nr:ABC transporter substrate-binding protein [Trichococcus sp.]